MRPASNCLLWGETIPLFRQPDGFSLFLMRVHFFLFFFVFRKFSGKNALYLFDIRENHNTLIGYSVCDESPLTLFDKEKNIYYENTTHSKTHLQTRLVQPSPPLDNWLPHLYPTKPSPSWRVLRRPKKLGCSGQQYSCLCKRLRCIPCSRNPNPKALRILFQLAKRFGRT